MWLLVGLGNPGRQYAGNRHNIGFMAVDEIVRRHGFSAPRAKFSGLLSEGTIGEDKVLVLKPGTYMNLSGDSVAAAARFHKIAPANIVVFHDELDLKPGHVKVKTGGGHAGHNGLRSIIGHLGPEFVRVRMGIGHPGDKDLVSPWVLSDFAKADRDWLEPLLDACAVSSPRLIEGAPEKFMTEVAGQLRPPPKPVKKIEAAAETVVPAIPAAPKGPMAAMLASLFNTKKDN